MYNKKISLGVQFGGRRLRRLKEQSFSQDQCRRLCNSLHMIQFTLRRV